jgi:hypothetical protein
MAELINRVANSGLITLNLEEHFPPFERVYFDLKDYLFQGLILKEKDFRTSLKEIDWAQYEGKVLLVHCSTDAIVPVWAYMLVSTLAAPHAADVFFGTDNQYLENYYRQKLSSLDYKQYDGQRVVIKGCSHLPVPAAAYMELSRRLQPYAQSIMYGEPCSTVPIFKRPRKV